MILIFESLCILNYELKKKEIKLELPNNSYVALLVGNHSSNLVKLEKLIDVNINLFGNQFHISGNAKNANLAKLIITNAYHKLSMKNSEITNFDFSNFETELRMLRGINKSKSNQNIEENSDFQFKYVQEIGHAVSAIDRRHHERFFWAICSRLSQII